jgi:predicted DNA-binding antitoxin AbrB/MazE fold protein
MSRTIPAIFDAGVFRPLQPVDLAEGTHVEVQVPVPQERETVRWRPLIDCDNAQLIEQAALDPKLDF